MKRTTKLLISVFTVLVSVLSLCACNKIRQNSSAVSETAAESVETVEENNEKISEDNALRSSMSEHAPKYKNAENDSTKHIGSVEGHNSLIWLRDTMDIQDIMFGAAQLGYVGGLFDEGFDTGFPAWLWENNEAMLLKYPFITEIDKEHIIGAAGFLYCIVPVDENATLAINRVQWNEKTRSYDVTDVIYRSESGEPVLLFANLDGVAYESDTQVIITDNSGNTCMWDPSMDSNSYLAPCMTETGASRLWDFTEYTWQTAPSELKPWLADGWCGMTAEGLAGSQGTGMSWCVNTTEGESDRNAFFSLCFYPGDETGGTVDLDWMYDDGDDFEEMWSGFWTIETELDGPSLVTISLSLVGGKSYGVKDGPYYMSETYPMLISPSGEDLLIGEGENDICLPFMSESTKASVLKLSVG